MVVTGNVLTTENNVEWKIDDFLLNLEGGRTNYRSPYFTLNGESWHFQIYKSGDICDHTIGYNLCIFRALRNFPIITEISVALKSVTGTNVQDRRFTKVFEWQCDNYELPQFISMTELLRRKTELVPSGVLTVICSLKILKSAKNAGDITTINCSYCKDKFVSENIDWHEEKCLNKPIKCPGCSEFVLLQNWYNHDCQVKKSKDGECLNQDFLKILLNGKNHDVILKVGEKELKAHRDILSARSRVFESMFIHDMKENNSGIIDIPDCDPKAMEAFLLYVYGGNVEVLDKNNMFGLYYIADKYQMKHLQEACSEYIKKSLSLINVCDAIKIALNHSDLSLLDYATEYFINNILDIMQTVEWQSFLKNNLTVGNELLIKSVKKLKNISD